MTGSGVSNSSGRQISTDGVTKGIVFEGVEGEVYGDITLLHNVTIPSGHTLLVPGGTTLTINSGVTLTNNGAVNNAGTINYGGEDYGIWTGNPPVGDYIVPVENITNVTETIKAGSPVALTGTVVPSGASNRTIIWSIADAGDTGATITEGNLNGYCYRNGDNNKRFNGKHGLYAGFQYYCD